MLLPSTDPSCAGTPTDMVFCAETDTASAIAELILAKNNPIIPAKRKLHAEYFFHDSHPY